MSEGIENGAIQLVTFLLMGRVGLDLTAGEFQRVSRRPVVLLAGLIVPPVVLPLLAVALTAALRPPSVVATGLLIIAVCPIGGISNVYSLLARADAALSVTLTTLSCLLAAITIPAVSRGLAFVTGNDLGLKAPAGLLTLQLIIMLALPVALGMIVRVRFPEILSRHHATFSRATFALIGLLLAVIIGSRFRLFLEQLSTTVLLALLFVVGSLAIGALIGLATRAARHEWVTLSLEFGTRNVPVAAAIAVTMLHRIDFALFGATYFLAELPVLLLSAAVFRTTAPSTIAPASQMTAGQ